MKINRGLKGILILVVLIVSVGNNFTLASSEPIEFYPIQDTYITDAGNNPSDSEINYGSVETIYFGRVPKGEAVAILEFSIDQNLEIEKIALLLGGKLYDANSKLVKFQLMENVDWDQSTITGSSDPINANDLPWMFPELVDFQLTHTSTTNTMYIEFDGYELSSNSLTIVIAGDVVEEGYIGINSIEKESGSTAILQVTEKNGETTSITQSSSTEETLWPILVFTINFILIIVLKSKKAKKVNL